MVVSDPMRGEAPSWRHPAHVAADESVGSVTTTSYVPYVAPLTRTSTSIPPEASSTDGEMRTALLAGTVVTTSPAARPVPVRWTVVLDVGASTFEGVTPVTAVTVALAGTAGASAAATTPTTTSRLALRTIYPPDGACFPCVAIVPGRQGSFSHMTN